MINSIAETADVAETYARPASQILAAIEIALRIGDAAIAEQSARDLIGLYPDAIAPTLALGRALVELGHWRQAIEHFRWAITAHPLDSSAWAGLAAALAVAGRDREARAALARAALHDPLDSAMLTPGVVSVPREGNGVSYLRQGHDALARIELAAALQARPDRDDLRLYYCEALRRCDERDEACRLLDALPDDLPPSLPVLLLRAALEPSETAARLQCARLDLDGQMTRRFFAPLRAPWDLLPPPEIALPELLARLTPYLAHATSGRKSAPGSVIATPPPPAPPPVPGDVREFLATAERLRARLVIASGSPQPLLPRSEAERQLQLILSSRAGLARRFGADGSAAIERKLRTLCDALARRGLHTQLAYIDDPETLRLSDSIQLGAVASEAPAVAGLVRGAVRALADHGRELGTVLLTGGPECLPFFRMPNPLPDDDPELLSDLPYAGADENDLAPRLMLARLPDGGTTEFLLDLLDRMIARHNGRQRGPLARFRPAPAAPRPAWTMASGYAAEAWREPARAILDALHPPADLTLCPPAEAGSLDLPAILGASVIYVNLHGAMGRSSWYGQPDAWGGAATALPVALRPEQVAGRCADGGLLVSEACYGLELAGKTSGNSIVLQAIRDGVAACIGSTVSAYGSYSVPLVGGDLLTERILAQLSAGLPIGAALCQARAEFTQTMQRRQGYLDDVDRKTLLSFVLYGDPWASLQQAGAAPRSWMPKLPAGLGQIGRTRSATPIDERQVPRELLRSVRETLRKVLPGAGDARLAISVRGDRRLSLKGDDAPDLVFSAREPVLTADGAVITQAAHITVSHRAVVKVALTR